jgi:hypothetical protein
MASASVEQGGRKIFSGDWDGLPLRHLKQMSQAQDVNIKMKPQGVNLTDNDRFVLLTYLLKGGARSQADQLQERMQKELDTRNALELTEYDVAVTMYTPRMAEWGALPLKGWVPAPVAPPPARPVVAMCFGTRWVSFGLCSTGCILSGPPAALRSTWTLKLCQGSQRPIW